MKRAKAVAVIGALDTKGVECGFVADCLRARGLKPLLVDCGVMPSKIRADIAAAEVAEEGGSDLAALRAKKDRGEAVAAMSRGMEALLPKLHAQGRFDGVIGLGGSAGTSVATSGMRQLPVGVPKVMVSTLGGTDMSKYVGVKDIVVIPSIVDILGINRISRQILARAAGAVAGMVEARIPKGVDKPLVVASMFGNTTPCVEAAKKILEKAGYEVLVFHATGTGGRAMESLVEAGLVAGVLDVTTTEWADELVGGVLTAGPARLEAAARRGVPAIVAPGCLDMVNFWAPETVPEKFKGRTFYPHNPQVTLMRTDVAESRRLGEILAGKLNLSSGPVTVLLPLKGVSMVDAPGGPFWWPDADGALYGALKKGLRKDIPVVEMDVNINDAAFSRRCAETLLGHMKAKGRKRTSVNSTST